MKYILTSCLCLLGLLSQGQEQIGAELLDKAIAFHDPKGNWKTFKSTFKITLDTPDNPVRESKITINLPEEIFQIEEKKEGNIIQYSLVKEECSISFNGSSSFSEEDNKQFRLNCERAHLWKDYYTYLYGLPMKLKDPGTHIDPRVIKKKFKGKDYLVLKVTYDENVGSDVWFFYFDPVHFALEVYQFYKGDPSGAGKDSGEYILLSETEIVNGIKMPKIRAWYYNKDDQYLGTDTLLKE